MLDQITTPTSRDGAQLDTRRFINVSVANVIASTCWKTLYRSRISNLVLRLLKPSRPAVQQMSDFLRRAVNIWNAAAAGLNLDTGVGHTLVGQPISSALNSIQEEAGACFRYRYSDDAVVTDILGKWRWFTGEAVAVEHDGFVTSTGDFGHIPWDRNMLSWVISWQRRALNDYVMLSSDGSALLGKNQYGDDVFAFRIK